MSCLSLPSRPSIRDRRLGVGRAFTLIELLVVIGIIALLISILMPALSKARESAKNIQCATNLRSIGQAVNMYAGDNKSSLPPIVNFGQTDGRANPSMSFSGGTHFGSAPNGYPPLCVWDYLAKYGITDEAGDSTRCCPIVLGGFNLQPSKNFTYVYNSIVGGATWDYATFKSTTALSGMHGPNNNTGLATISPNLAVGARPMKLGDFGPLSTTVLLFSDGNADVGPQTYSAETQFVYTPQMPSTSNPCPYYRNATGNHPAFKTPSRAPDIAPAHDFKRIDSGTGTYDLRGDMNILYADGHVANQTVTAYLGGNRTAITDTTTDPYIDP